MGYFIACIIVICIGIIIIIFADDFRNKLFGIINVVIGIILIIALMTGMKAKNPSQEQFYEKVIICKKVGNKMIPVDTTYKGCIIIKKK